MRYPTALTIAGSDSGGGAGIQADLKTFSAIGVFGTSVITSITAQNTREVRAVEALSAKIIRQQLEVVFDDIKIDAVKTGMLVSPGIIKIIAEVIDKYKPQQVIVDPVMVATAGANLTKASISGAFHKLMFPRLTLLTPNIPEAERLTGITIKNDNDRRKAGEIFLEQGCEAVLIKGGHMPGKESVDMLFTRNAEPEFFSSSFIRTKNVHGTGCSLASAIAAYLALGFDLKTSIEKAKEYIANAIAAGACINFNGNGPVNHFFSPSPLKPIEP